MIKMLKRNLSNSLYDSSSSFDLEPHLMIPLYVPHVSILYTPIFLIETEIREKLGEW